jgi:3',5'-nucleoside bisphosphate phosphatase
MHSTASDGTLTPERVVKRAVKRGVRVMALTDHDTTSGLDAALAEARRWSIDIIPGIEINTDSQGTEVHILGYFINPRSHPLQARLQEVRAQRESRMQRMLDRLGQAGLPISEADVRKHAQGQSVGRPHVALALVDKKLVGSVREAFDLWIGKNGAAYVPRASLTPHEAIELIREAEGVPVLAHPCYVGGEDAIVPLIQAGLGGIEALYLQHNAAQQASYSALAERYGLGITGGSDFHGFQVKRKVDIGDNRFTLADLRRFCETVGHPVPRLARADAALPREHRPS